jgi:hypothetical protein
LFIEELTMLEYVLELNELTDTPNDYRARVVNVRTYTQADIIDRIMGIGAGLTRSDILSVLEAEKQVLAAIVAEGGAVNTELFSAYPSIQGVFTLSAEPDARTVRLNLHPGKALRDALSGVKARKVSAPPTGTIIEAVTDIKTGSVNGALTPNRDLRITGSKLKIAGEEAGNGVYFVNAADGSRTAVDPTDIVENNPGSLLVVIPALAAGTYNVQIVTQYTSGGTPLKTPRTATFDKPLTVE